MIGRKAMIGLSLLCALLFSAIAVQSASATAAPATNTTAVTCVPVSPGTGDFTDAHCDNKGTGNFAHKALASGLGKTTEEVEVTNETTGGAKSTQVLKGKPFGVPTTISCTTVSSKKNSIGNTEEAGKVHKISGKGTITYTGCTVTEVKNCTKVKEPIVASIGSIEGVEGLTGPKGEANAMGLEYKAPAGGNFAEITLEGTCAIAGKAFPVQGSVIATSGPGPASAQTNHWAGATQVFETASAEMQKLTAGGNAATYTGITTTKMESGNPISGTTCTTTSNCLE